MGKNLAYGVLWISIMTIGCLSGQLLCGQTVPAQRGAQVVGLSDSSPLSTGSYYALVIGNQNYSHFDKLATPSMDAKEVAQVLQDRYGFRTEVLLDASRTQILIALGNYRKDLTEDSSLLIYYAGHGHHDRDADEAYWLPVDSGTDNNANWISADDITSDIKAIKARHILVVSDSCYSGYIGAPRLANPTITPKERRAFLKSVLKGKSRNLMSSGGDEPVADNGAPGHSIFAAAFLDSLLKIDEDTFTASELFHDFVQPRVGGGSLQLPEYYAIRNSGHDGGDFVFSRISGSKGTVAGTSTTNKESRPPGKQKPPAAPEPKHATDVAECSPASNPRYEAEFQKSYTSEVALGNAGEAAFNRGDYEWSCKFLQQAQRVSTLGMWRQWQPYLAGDLYKMNRPSEAEEILSDLVFAVDAKQGFLSNSHPIGFVLNNLGKVRNALPSEYQTHLKDIIDHITQVKNSM